RKKRTLPSRTNISAVNGRKNSTSESDNQHHVVLRRRDRGQLNHLLLDPTTHRWERPAEVDRDVMNGTGMNVRGRNAKLFVITAMRVMGLVLTISSLRVCPESPYWIA